MPTLAGSKQLFFVFPPEAASFPSFDGKYTGLIRWKRTSKCLFPRRHSEKQQKEKIKKFSKVGKKILKFIRLSKKKEGFMITFLKCIYDLTAHRLQISWTKTRCVASPFLISTIWFLILTNAVRNGSVYDCSIASLGAAEVIELS